MEGDQIETATDRRTAATIGWLDRRLGWIGVAIIMLPASLIAPSDLSFLPNLLYFTLPPLAVAGLVGMVCWRGAALLGSACVLSAYLCLYGVWTGMLNHAGGFAWLGYLLSMPGAGLGGLIGALIARDYRDHGPRLVGLICAGGCLVGLAINQTGLCMSVMYCGI